MTGLGDRLRCDRSLRQVTLRALEQGEVHVSDAGAVHSFVVLTAVQAANTVGSSRVPSVRVKQLSLSHWQDKNATMVQYIKTVFIYQARLWAEFFLPWKVQFGTKQLVDYQLNHVYRLYTLCVSSTSWGGGLGNFRVLI